MTDLVGFLRSKQEEEERKRIHAEPVKKEWLAAVDRLFGQVRTWLEEPVAEDLIHIEEDAIDINELSLGHYQAPRLKLHVGQELVVLEPVGRVVIGAKGRVDLKADGKSRILVLTNEGRWGFLGSPDHSMATELTKETFTDALKALLS